MDKGFIMEQNHAAKIKYASKQIINSAWQVCYSFIDTTSRDQL